MRRIDTTPAGESGSPGQIRIFIIGDKIFVKPADFIKDDFTIQAGAPVRSENFLNLIVSSVVRFSVSPIPWLEVAGLDAGIHDRSGIIKTDDFRRTGPGTRIFLDDRHHRRDAVYIQFCIIVKRHYIDA